MRVGESGHPDFSPYARAAAEIADPPAGLRRSSELRLTDYVSANAAMAAAGHELWDTIPAVATPHGWTWHHVSGGRRMELVRRGEGAAASSRRSGDHGCDQDRRGTLRPLQETRPAHFRLPKGAVAVSEQQIQGVEEDLGYRLPGAYRSFLKAAGGSAPVDAALDAGWGCWWTSRSSRCVMRPR
ncbi:Knr4/Smi1-like domain-containing protein OS=Streptomyces microflavus OX=1919 GN=Smic_30700 PE=4 SV=1 [Streptomyces microflavus]